ncbi:MAG: metallophosphoesterase [Firmicutes bacterium]|nr:metallophosphoesterase [Bacillota bacterium]
MLIGLFFVTVLLLLGALIGVTGRQLYLWLKVVSVPINSILFTCIYVLIVFGFLAVFICSHGARLALPRRLYAMSHYAVGILFYLALIMCALALVYGLLQLLHIVPRPLPARLRLICSSAAVALALLVSVYGIWHAADIRVKEYDVALDGGGASAMKVALISDIHLGYIMDTGRLEKVVAAVNATQPHLVCIAGDIFNSAYVSLDDPAAMQAVFRKLEAPFGVYACLGNHDAGSAYAQMTEFLAAANIRLLLDEAVVVDERLLLAGRRDSTPIGAQGDKRTALSGIYDSELPVLLLDHQPGNIGEYDDSIDLILCGHTHRGQVFPGSLITDALYEVDYGYYQKDAASPQVIVTSGIGTWGPPLRVGSDAEVVLIELSLPQ